MNIRCICILELDQIFSNDIFLSQKYLGRRNTLGNHDDYGRVYSKYGSNMVGKDSLSMVDLVERISNL